MLLRAIPLLSALALLLSSTHQAGAALVSAPPASPPPSTAENASTAFWPNESESRIGLLCHNDPVNHSDPLGLYFSFPEDKVLRERLQTQLKEIGATDKRLGDMIKQLADSKNKIELRLPDKKGDVNKTSFNKRDATNGKGTGSVIRYDPDNTNVYARSPQGSLTHELRHAEEADSGTYNPGKLPNGLPTGEQRAVQRANIFMQESNIPLRTTYGGLPLDPTPQ